MRIFLILLVSLLYTECIAATTTSITQYGITWTFSSPVTYGQFVNGDYYVVDSGGGVVLSGVSNNFHVVDLTTVDYDGSQLNANWTATEIARGVGFDSKLTGYKESANINKHLPYTIHAGDSILTAISWLPGDVGIPLNVATGGVPQEKRIAILTCLDSDVGPTAFRPSYTSGAKTIYYSTSIDWSKLPSLATVSGASSASAYADVVQGPWTDLWAGYTSQYARPTDNYVGGVGNAGTYNRYVAAKYGDAVLASTLDAVDIGDKTRLVINLIQIGIDYYGTLQAGGKWSADGGHQHGYKLPILYAGLLLNNSGMLSIGIDYLPNTNTFQDDATMFTITADLMYPNRSVCGVNNGVLPSCLIWHDYQQYSADNGVSVGMPEWGAIHSVDVSKDDASSGAAYRTINAGPLSAHSLAALILGMKTQWNNSIFFDYHDRWVTTMGGYLETTFSQNMWTTYRASYPPVWGFNPSTTYKHLRIRADGKFFRVEQ